MQECHYEVRQEDRKSTAQHVIAVPESVRRGPTPKSSPFKAAPIQSTASTRRDDFATPTDMARPTKRNHQLRRRRYNPPGTACERVVLDKIKIFWSESIKVKVGGLKAAASSCCSTHLEGKEQVEAFKCLMQRVVPKQRER